LRCWDYAEFIVFWKKRSRVVSNIFAKENAWWNWGTRVKFLLIDRSCRTHLYMLKIQSCDIIYLSLCLVKDTLRGRGFFNFPLWREWKKKPLPGRAFSRPKVWRWNFKIIWRQMASARERSTENQTRHGRLIYPSRQRGKFKETPVEQGR